jgi:hypothetical protein
MRRLAIVMTAVAVIATVASSTDARIRDKVQTKLDPSTITSSSTGDAVTAVSGAITSPKGRCVPGRTVRVTSGPTETLQSPYGSSTTDALGHFEVSGSAPAGSFFSIFVDKRRRGNIVCKTTAAFAQLPR